MVCNSENYFGLALAEAEKAFLRDEVPIGAVLVENRNSSIISVSGNRVEEFSDPTAHAEMLVIQEGVKRLNIKMLSSCDLYVTLEPCAMCAQAISYAKVRRLYFGAYDPKSGGVEHGAKIFQQTTCHYRPEVYGGIDEIRCSKLLESFFRERR